MYTIHVKNAESLARGRKWFPGYSSAKELLEVIKVKKPLSHIKLDTCMEVFLLIFIPPNFEI